MENWLRQPNICFWFAFKQVSNLKAYEYKISHYADFGKQLSSLVDTNRGSCYYTGRAYLGATFSCYLGQSNNPYIHGYRGYYFYIGGFYNMSEKEFKTYDQQLDILESRGLIVENRAAAIEYLSDF